MIYTLFPLLLKVEVIIVMFLPHWNGYVVGQAHLMTLAILCFQTIRSTYITY